MVSRPGARALYRRVAKIRVRGVLPRFAKTETMRESHARELIARKLVLPSLKRLLGNNLLAVVMPGSTQLGVRLATRKRKTSDLDLTIVVKSPTYHKKGDEIDSLLFLMGRKVRNTFGIECAMHVVPEKIFIYDETHQVTLSAFQVISGKQWILQTFGEGYAVNFPMFREQNKRKPKHLNMS